MGGYNTQFGQAPAIPGLTPEQITQRISGITQGIAAPTPAYRTTPAPSAAPPQAPTPPVIPGITPPIAQRPTDVGDILEGAGQIAPQSSLGNRVAPFASIPEHEMVPAYQAMNPNLSEHEAGKLAFQELRPKIDQPLGTPDYYKQRAQQIQFDIDHPWGAPISAHPGTLGKLGHVLGTIGNIAGDILAPQTMALIPQTQLGQRFQEAQMVGAEGGAERRQIAEQEALAKTAQAQATGQEAQARAAETQVQLQKLQQGEVVQSGDGFYRMLPDGSIKPLTDPATGKTLSAKEAAGNWQTQVYRALTADGVSPEEAGARVASMEQSAKAEPDKERDISDYLAANRMADTPANRERARAVIAQRGKQEPGNFMPLYDTNPASPTYGQLTGAWDPKSGRRVGAPAGGGTTSAGAGMQARRQAAFDKQALPEQNVVDTANEAHTLAERPSATNDYALLMDFIGVTKPESVGKIRLNTQEINLVKGTRSSFGDLEAMAEKVYSGQMLTPQQRKDMLTTMDIVANSARQHLQELRSGTSGGGAGGGGGGAGGGGTDPFAQFGGKSR